MSQLTGKLKKANVGLNRKMLAQLAMVDPGAFAKVVDIAKQADWLKMEQGKLIDYLLIISSL